MVPVNVLIKGVGLTFPSAVGFVWAQNPNYSSRSIQLSRSSAHSIRIGLRLTRLEDLYDLAKKKILSLMC